MYYAHAEFTIKQDDGQRRHEPLRMERTYQSEANAVAACDRMNMEREFNIRKAKLSEGEVLISLRAYVENSKGEIIRARSYPEVSDL